MNKYDWFPICYEWFPTCMVLMLLVAIGFASYMTYIDVTVQHPNATKYCSSLNLKTVRGGGRGASSPYFCNGIKDGKHEYFPVPKEVLNNLEKR